VDGPDPRARARELARESIARGDDIGWFERLYAESQRDGSAISWLDMEPNPYLVEWLAQRPQPPTGLGLVVGCGYGDDAELLAAAGLDVTAFDVAASAIARCRARFPQSRVNYELADALHLPAAWTRAFDFVFDAYTIQVLSGAARAACALAMGNFVAPNGVLLVVARGRGDGDPEGQMPWPLTRAELDGFAVLGLTLARLGDVIEPGDPPVRRFGAELRG
jgi:SAM-dependent methyltransferase